MANIKSQKKRIVTSEIARQANKSKKTAIATQIRKYKDYITAKSFEDAQKQLSLIFSLIDRARLDGIYHPNTASRKKASLALLLSGAQKTQE